jgi:hypothetical protein
MQTVTNSPLKNAVHKYIQRFYPDLNDFPDVQLLAEKDYDSLITFHTQGAAYEERDNTIYFKDIATPTVICCMVHRWSQYHKMGHAQFYEMIRNASTRALADREANIAASEAVFRHKRFTQSFRLLDNEVIEFFK